MVAADPVDAAAMAAGMGFPVVLKILSQDISHKSDVGGVALGLDTHEAVHEAAQAMLARVRRQLPKARIEGFTVQTMVRMPHAQELIVGTTVDRIFGPVILFGQGGTSVEVVADDAGRRAAARALEATLPHATDLRQARFLFLPPEHDPDSFVREQGPQAFEQAIAQATPLSRQLLLQAAADCDLGTAEGRARMLAQARPMWSALPDGALRRQLLGELARTAQLGPDDLDTMWQLSRQTAASRPQGGGTAGQLPALARRPGRLAGRIMPTASADLALRLLLRHADWWDRLAADDHQRLHRLGGDHAALVVWLEQQITDHGAQTWAALDEALSGHELRVVALRIADPASLDDRHDFDDLLRVLHRLWIDELNAQVQQLIGSGCTDREQLDRIAAIHHRLRQHKEALAMPTNEVGPV